MIRWYDYVVSILMAYAILWTIFIPFIGWVAAYYLYTQWEPRYCAWRLEQERGM